MASLRQVLTELTAQITQTGVKVSTMDRSLNGATRFTPEQVTAAIRQKLIVSGYKITGTYNIKTAGANQYSVAGPGINLVATFDNNSGKVDLFQGGQQTMQPAQKLQVQQPQPVQQPIAQPTPVPQ